MKFSINHATQMKTSLEEFLLSVKKAGFDGVELRRDETFDYLETHSVEELKKLIENLGLEVVTWNAIELFSLCSDEDFQHMYDYSERLMKIGNKINCDTIIAVPSFSDRNCVYPKEKFDEMTIERFQTLRKLADKYNFRMGFEPLGFPTCSVRKIEHALNLLEASEEDGLGKSGLIIDTFHFFLGEHTIEDLKKIPLERLWLIHFNDCMEKPIAELQDSDRVWPGEGFFNLKGFTEILREMSYNNYISLELFNEEYWKASPEKTAKNAMNSLKKFF